VASYGGVSQGGAGGVIIHPLSYLKSDEGLKNLLPHYPIPVLPCPLHHGCYVLLQ